MSDTLKMSVKSLIQQCKDMGIKGYSGKNKSELLELIKLKEMPTVSASVSVTASVPVTAFVPNNVPINVSIPMSASLKFIDLFCGIGGFHQAMKQFGGECVFACDIDKHCREIYETNYGLKPHSDITTAVVEDIPDFDVICAGFPCQSFSNSGKKKGLSDKRGNLFEYILKIAVVKRPRFMFLENVKHIKKIDNGDVFTHILKRINESGYNVSVFELSPHQLGVPQQRERVIFVCVRNDLPTQTLTIDPPKTKIDLSLFLDKTVDAKYKVSPEIENILEVWDEMINKIDVGDSLSPTILCNEFNTIYTPSEFKALPKWKQDYINKNKPIYNKYKEHWDKWYEINHELLQSKEVFGKLEWQVGPKKKNDSIFNYFIQIRQSGIRVKKTNYFPTLVAIVQTPIYAKERRYITPRECARLQSFPDDFIIHKNDHTAYKQFGNAVNVKVVHYVINETFKLYSGCV
jgi:DNA (cytosine-5)-methyltransferase 1